MGRDVEDVVTEEKVVETMAGGALRVGGLDTVDVESVVCAENRDCCEIKVVEPVKDAESVSALPMTAALNADVVPSELVASDVVCMSAPAVLIW